MQLEKIKTEKKDKRLKLWCECCGEQFDRWLIDMVEPENCVFEINGVLDDLGEAVEFNFACPECVTELALVPVKNDRANLFRERNEKLRIALAPTSVH